MSSITCVLLQNILLEFVINIASRVPGATYPAMKFIFEALQLFSPQNRVDVSDEIVNLQTLQQRAQMKRKIHLRLRYDH